MKITEKILKRRAKRTLETTTCLDLSELGIGAIEGLRSCGNLQVLDLSHNNIEEVEGISCCQHLWNINFSHNELSSLTELSHFYALGTVNLSFNKLSWQDLARIQDVIILDLYLHGNPALENDMYYRIHVIDCLPNIWMLDGRLITSAERQQVEHFFHDSALSSHPVRRKLTVRPHTSSTRQRMNAGSVHGCRTSMLVSKFARNEIHSADTDLRRLVFLFENLQDDLSAMPNCPQASAFSLPENFLTSFINQRHNDREKCNILLLLLLASLEFQLPADLLTETLLITKLDTYADVDTTLLFAMERRWRIRLASLLLSASKLDRDMCVEDAGGLYDRLYLCLYYLVSGLVRSDWKNWKRKSTAAERPPKKQKPYLTSYLRPQTAPSPDAKELAAAYAKRLDQSREEHTMLLASEIVLLLSVVPSFYKHIESDTAMRTLLRTATNDTALTNKIIAVAKEARVHGKDVQDLYKEISDHSVQQIERATISIRYAAIQQYLFPTPRNRYMPTNATRSEWEIILSTKNAYPRRPKSAVLTSGEHLSSGRRRTYADMQRGFNVKPAALQSLPPEPKICLGSNILLGPQNMARVIAIPESNLALVQMNSIPAPNGSVIIQTKNQDDHYCYVDATQLQHDYHLGCWKPRGTMGDKVTLQSTTDAKLNITSLSRSPDALIFERDYNRQAGETRASRRSSLISGKMSATPRNIPSPQTPSALVLSSGAGAGLKELLEEREHQGAAPPRPLSALFKEKMNLRLPGQLSDMWTETDSQNVADELSQADAPAVPKMQLEFAQEDNESNVARATENEGGLAPSRVDENEMEGDEKDEGIGNALARSGEISLGQADFVEQVEVIGIPPTEDLNVDGEEKPHEDVAIGEMNFNETELELQALMGDQPSQDQHATTTNSDDALTKKNRATDLRKRAISARQPKHAKFVESHTRPLSAVTRARDLRSRRGSPLYRDDVETDRPESVSSFQLARTEAWRSSASSSVNITFDRKASKRNSFGFMTVPEHRRKTSFHVVALRPTPPQRPSSPSQSPASRRPESREKKQSKGTPVIMYSSRDKGMKLASNWLADGRDLHEQYKKSRVYMSPRVPGYLDGVANQSTAKKNVGASLPLTASLAMKLEKLSAIRESSKRVSPVSVHLRGYLPPGIGVPEPAYQSRFSALGDVKQLVGRYPKVSTIKPKKK